MVASDLVNLSGLLDDAKGFALVRQHRWPTGVRCPGRDSNAITRDGRDDTQPNRQRISARHRVSVCHGRGEYARHEDGDDLCESHVNMIEGSRSLLRSWLRPHRGISQEKLPGDLGFFRSCITHAVEAKPSSRPYITVLLA